MRVKIIVLSFVVNNMYNVVINVVKFVILILFAKKNFFVHSIITHLFNISVSMHSHFASSHFPSFALNENQYLSAETLF